MFILPAADFPKTTDDLISQLRKGLDARASRAGGAGVAIAGDFPKLDAVKIDLSNARVDASATKADVAPVGEVQSGPSTKSFSVTAKPIHFENVLADLEIFASEVSFGYAHNKAGKAMLLLQDAKEGKLTASISQRDLEEAVVLAARMGAAAHGVAIQKAQVQLRAIDPRTVDVDMTITAKKMMTAIIRVTGRATIDEGLNAIFSKINADGDGMVASIAVGMLRPQLKKIEGQKFSLSAFSLGNVKLKDVKVSTTNGLKLEAQFGSSH